MKKVFIDCGANLGQSIELFIETWDNPKDYEIHCFEANQDFEKKLNFKRQLYPDFNININIPVAVWDKDTEGELNFYGSGEGGAAVDESTPKTGSSFIARLRDFKPKSISLANWILNNFSKEDYIVLKLDIEGAEYRIIEDLKNKNVLNYINEFFYEWHGPKKGYTFEDDMNAFTTLKEAGITPKLWNGNWKEMQVKVIDENRIKEWYVRKSKQLGKRFKG
tara:strand:+ start:8122 stop:8784 length:663 start_codon:yes stop_codon:yes gene_type:complete